MTLTSSLLSRLVATTAAVACLCVNTNAHADPDEGQNLRSQRATVLARHLAPYDKNTATDYLGYATGGVGLALTGAAVGWLASTDNPTGPGSEGGWVAIAGLGITGIGGFVSYAPDEDYYLPALTLTTDLGMGTGYVGLSMLMGPIRDRAFAIGAAAHYARAGLRIVDMTMVRPVSRGRLAAHYHTIRRANQRASITEEELAHIELDLARRDGALSPWLLHAPLMLGGAATLALMADENATSADRLIMGIQGGTLLMHGAVAALTSMGGGFEAYEGEIDDRGLRVAVGPGPGIGLGVHGTW